MALRRLANIVLQCAIQINITHYILYIIHIKLYLKKNNSFIQPHRLKKKNLL